MERALEEADRRTPKEAVESVEDLRPILEVIITIARLLVKYHHIVLVGNGREVGRVTAANSMFLVHVACASCVGGSMKCYREPNNLKKTMKNYGDN